MILPDQADNGHVLDVEDQEDVVAACGVREPIDDSSRDRHDCLFCGAYVNTECARCGALIMSMIPGNDGSNRCMDVCYECDLDMSGLAA